MLPDQQANHDRCTQEGIERMAMPKLSTTCGLHLGSVVSCLGDNSLKLILSNKEGGFVVAPAVMGKA